MIPNQINENQIKKNLLASYLEVDPSEIRDENDEFVLPIDETYLVLDESEVVNYLEDCLEEQIPYFNPGILADLLYAPTQVFEAMQEANLSISVYIDLIERLHEGEYKGFVENFYDIYGAGEILATYDGQEIILPNNYYAYRTQ